MSKTLLNGLNEVAKSSKIISGDAQAFTTLIDSGRQHHIDLIVQSWNEIIQELYTVAEMPFPSGLGESTITLLTDDRDYALNTALTRLYYPLLDETNGRTITEYEGGYLDLVNSQLTPANYTGLPIQAVIRPTDGELYMDRIPKSSENGLVYKYRYEKSLLLVNPTDTVPFNDDVFTALVPAVTEYYRGKEHRESDSGIINLNIGRAARLLRKQPPRASYLVGRSLSDTGFSTKPTWDNPIP